MKQDRTWIVVADGAKARILLYKPHQKGVQQLPDGEFHDSHPATHDLVTERQPRVHDSVGHARHAVEPRIDPHDQRETRFLTRLAAHLDGAEQRGEFEHLVVVAPATALGELRKAFGPHLHKRLFSEIVHDYAHQSNDYIYQHIKDSLPL
ncbi:MAG TPA: host attachment protein [Aestuariivirga sp.]|jgi:protein required for attachment to host cells|nr:host attachment protein [Hyphomicrobiales bacterium]MBP9173583.1 host attachment protein [Hyphomicrobiales bacterium]MCC7481687.1 host attachment protein [Hyphomicrobiales bacterium]HQY73423.1 host attachment protein [Aestuariivirga sp.]HRA93124.1 host attachment protein [Aestuariivirga sp.]